MRNPLSAIGNANFRANSYAGFSEPAPEPVGDVEADVDNDPSFRQRSLDRIDFAIANVRRFVAEQQQAEGVK